jgi:excisionase family DNA binding protein
VKTPELAYLSIKEFAEMLNVHPNTIRNSIKSGRINAFKIGSGKKSMYRIPTCEVERMALISYTLNINTKIV